MRLRSFPVLALAVGAVILPPVYPVGSEPGQARAGIPLSWFSCDSLRPKSERVVKFKQVSKGMTREQVIATVGAPPGDYTTRPFSDPPTTSGWAMFAHGVERWVYDEARLVVQFRDGRASIVKVERPFLPPLPPRRP